MNVQLKEILLEKAIHGELVSNDKNLKPIDVESVLEDIPYEIPENWKWTLFQDIAIIVRGSSPRPIKEYLTKSPKGIHWIKIGDAKPNEYYINQTKEKITEEGKKKSRYVEKGSLLLSNSMSYGRPYILNVSGCIHDGWLNIKKKEEYFDTKYIMYILSSKYFYTIMSEKSVGSVVNNLNIEKVKSLKIPLPPIEEQKRIVEKLEECFELIDQKEKNDQEQERLKQLLKETLLEKAIHGELIPNDKNLKPVNVESVLDDIPYEIPENWKWVLLKNVGEWKSGSTPSKENQSYYENGSIPWALTGDLNDGHLTSVKHFITEKAVKECNMKINKENSVMIAMYGATIGKVAINDLPLTTNQACCVCECHPEIINYEYLRYTLISQRKKFIEKAEGSGQLNINKRKIIEYIIPLPPIEEQKRIVEKLEECFELIERL